MLLRDTGGGLLFGLLHGLVVFRMRNSVDNYEVGVLLSLEVVTGGYALASRLNFYGQLAMVVAGLIIEILVARWPCPIRPADMSRRERSEKNAATVQEQGLAVDILVSCAGILEYGHFAPMPVATHESHINLNVSGLTIFLAPVVERGKGRILSAPHLYAGRIEPLEANWSKLTCLNQPHKAT